MAYENGDPLSTLIGAIAKPLKVSGLQLSGRGHQDLERLLTRVKLAEIQRDEYLNALRDILTQLEDATREWTSEELRAVIVIATLHAKTNCDLRALA